MRLALTRQAMTARPCLPNSYLGADVSEIKDGDGGGAASVFSACTMSAFSSGIFQPLWASATAPASAASAACENKRSLIASAVSMRSAA